LPASGTMNFVNSAASELASTVEQNASGLGAAMQHA